MQKYVETLDLMKIKNPMPEQRDSLIDSPNLVEKSRRSSSGASPVVITTQWETFDPAPSTSVPAGAPSTSGQPNFTWDLL